MKRFLIIIAAGVFLSEMAWGQIWKLMRYEISAGIGTTQFYGDLGGRPNTTNVLGLKDFTFRNTGINIYGGLRCRLYNDFAVKLNLAGGLFRSTDAGGINAARGYASTTTFFEPAVIGEYYIVKNKKENNYLYMKGKRERLTSKLSSLDIYLFAGLGGLLYNVSPNTRLASHATGTNGFTLVVPLGIGMKYICSPRLLLGLELGARSAGSDNIDGFTSPTSSYNDVYHFFDLTVNYRMKTSRHQLTAF